MSRFNYEKLNKRDLGKGRTWDNRHRKARSTSSNIITDRQADYIDKLEEALDMVGVNYIHERKPTLMSDASSRIRYLQRQLLNNGYDTRGRKKNDKKDFLEYMRKRK